MDIIITIPKNTDMALYMLELKAVENSENIISFKVPTFPKQTVVGDRCYICHNGEVIGYHTICGFSQKKFVCEITGKVWNGKFVERSGKLHKVTGIKMRGFQGWKYYKQ